MENKIEKRNYVVYKHTSPSNKVYIGITGQIPPEKRWANGHGYTQNEYFNSEIIQYGWDKFSHEILFYGLTKDEAIAYIKDEVLKSRLIKISEVLLELNNNNATEIFGYPDDLKLKSCMTLFSEIAPEIEVFDKVLEKFFSGKKDNKTVELLKK